MHSNTKYAVCIGAAVAFGIVAPLVILQSTVLASSNRAAAMASPMPAAMALPLPASGLPAPPATAEACEVRSLLGAAPTAECVAILAGDRQARAQRSREMEGEAKRLICRGYPAENGQPSRLPECR